MAISRHIRILAISAVLVLLAPMLAAADPSTPVLAPNAGVINQLPNDPAYVKPKRFDWKKLLPFKKKEAPPPDPDTIINVGPRQEQVSPGGIVRINTPFCLPQQPGMVWPPGVYRAVWQPPQLQLSGPRQQGSVLLHMAPSGNLSPTGASATIPGTAPPPAIGWDMSLQQFRVRANNRVWQSSSVSCR